MEHIKRFKTNSEFLSEKSTFPYPCVSYIQETEKVEYKNRTHINARFKLTQEIYDEYVNEGEFKLFEPIQHQIHSYSINGIKYGPFAKPIVDGYDDNIVEFYIDDRNFCKPTNDFILNNSNIDLNTKVVCSEKINLDDICNFCTFVNGVLDEGDAYTIQQAIDMDRIILDEESNTLYFTEDRYNVIKNSSDIHGFLFYICTQYEYDNNIIPNNVTTFKTSRIINKDALFSNPISVNVDETCLGKEYNLKIFYYDEVNNYGDFSKALSYIDLSNYKENELVTIKENAFKDYKYLTDVVLGENIKEIDYWAFYKCQSLTSITCNAIEAPVIKSDTFEEVAVGGKLYCPKGSDYSSWLLEYCYLGIYNWVDVNNPSELIITYQVLNDNDTVKLFDAQGSLTNMYVNDSSELVDVTPSYTFNTAGQHVIRYPYNKGTLDCTFENCENIISVVMPNTILYIREYAFYSCDNLTSVTLSKNTREIYDEAFYKCAFENIDLPHSLDAISNNVFANNKNLKSFYIPARVYHIGTNPLFGCDSLTSITVSDKNTDYDSRNNCNAIITTYSKKLISGCKTTIIPEDIEIIGSFAFNSCPIESITIPNSVTIIEDGSFSYSHLTSLTIPNSVTSIGMMSFNGCEKLKQVKLSESLTEISESLFDECINLTSIEIPNSVKIIQQYAFHGCSALSSIVIPNLITIIKQFAFSSCSSLNSITCNAITAPTIYSKTFNNIQQNGTLYYPSGSDYSSWISLLPADWTSQEITA